ncbi:MAG: ergothioneine biosynthesis protein EgtB [Thiobacillaceae bacterium]
MNGVCGASRLPQDERITNEARAIGLAAYERVRKETELLCAPLKTEDYVIQTKPEASPAKWHLAHVSWFFETFLLIPYRKRYEPFQSGYEHLFNSYYEQLGCPWPRPDRGFLSRPTVEDVYRYRAHVDAHIRALMQDAGDLPWPEIQRRLTIGINHEQQHQELLLTDLLLNFSVNPVRPAYREDHRGAPARTERPLGWVSFAGGLCEIGDRGQGFAYDNESPRHRTYLRPFSVADRLVTNAEYLAFMEDDGYRTPALWLADGWAAVKRLGWRTPQYWEKIEGQWWTFTLFGMRKLILDEPVCHVSHYEAQAYAAWLKKRLPTEPEWEVAATALPVVGNLRDTGYLHPVASPPGKGLTQIYGDVWEHTASGYQPYPGYRADRGALGEYNGKFMCNQYVLRGGSCVTPADHIRASYRNFFYPHERWQFLGIRLADDAE